MPVGLCGEETIFRQLHVAGGAAIKYSLEKLPWAGAPSLSPSWRLTLAAVVPWAQYVDMELDGRGMRAISPLPRMDERGARLQRG